MFSLDELFCAIDDFCLDFEPTWNRQLLQDGKKHRIRRGRLSLSEIMTIEVAFHKSPYKNFKTFYLGVVQQHWHEAFPELVSYQRFVELIPNTIIPLMAYLRTCMGTSTGIGFIDSTKIQVCHNRRINSHKVFKDIAKRGKTSVDWFFGFKLHLVVNHRGELLNVALTTGNVDDRKPVKQLFYGLWGNFYGDKGYISASLARELRESGVILVTKFQKRMKNRLMNLVDRQLLQKRAMVESVIQQLKCMCQIEHTRHRSPLNFLANLFSALIAYCHHSSKPSIALDKYALPTSI